jgi:putative transposase
MKIKRAYKYRIYPNKSQQDKLSVQFGSTRFVYNYFLRKRIDHYAETGKGLTYHDTALQLTTLKKHDDYIWLKESDSQTIQQSLRDLDVAYGNFFSKRAKFPKFKKKHGKQACRFPQRFKIENNKLYVPKVGWIKIVLHRPIEGVMKNLTVSKTKSGKYFASIQVEQEIESPTYTGGQIGIDLGLKDFAVTSDGQKFQSPKYLRKSERRLKRYQRKLSKSQKGSSGRNKARLKVAILHEKVTNQRLDFTHKLSRKLIDSNCFIALEDLHVKGMLKNHCLAKSINDSGWSTFTAQLAYKGTWYGCHIEKLDRFFPSSKRCFQCGFINQNLKLSDRSWSCPECKVTLDRDQNAAQNILKFCTVGATEIKAAGQTVRPVFLGTSE